MLEVQEVDRSSPLIRRTTVDIGRARQWPSQGWDDQQWQTYLRRPHLRRWVAFIDGTRQWTVWGQIRLERPDYGLQLDSDALSVEQKQRPSPFPQQDRPPVWVNGVRVMLS